MKKFDAANLSRLLMVIQGIPEMPKPHWENRLKLLEINLETLAQNCESYGLAVSGVRILALRRFIECGLATTPDGLTAELSDLNRTIQDELSTKLFMALEPAEAKAWNNKETFGALVSEKFPEIDFELEEQSKCYAIGRYTAAVFHLMRVLEIGLNSTAQEIGYDPADNSWDRTLKGMESTLARIGQSKPQNWKQVEQHYSELIAHFRNLKNAWRNYVMHRLEKYDEEREEEIFVHVRAVMKLLTANPVPVTAESD